MARVAVIGPAGSGKSFLINQLLGREAVKHEVSGYPVTMEISSGHHFVDESGQSIELVDTPGLWGHGVVERDLTNHLDSLHMVIVVLARKRLEPTESSQIRSMLKFFNHKENPAKFLFVMNDRRDKSGNRDAKEDDLRTCLSLLEVDNTAIVQPGDYLVNGTFDSLAMTLSNVDCEQFKREVNQIRHIIRSTTLEMKNLLPPKRTNNRTRKLILGLAGAAAAVLFAYFLIKVFSQ